MNPINNIKERLKNKNNSSLTAIIKLIKDLSCLPEIIGRNYEVYDSKGKVIYRIEQKPITLPQLYELQVELNKLDKLENSKVNKLGKFGKGRK